MGYDGSLKFDTKVDESGFNQGTKKLGTIAKSGMAVLATAVAGCVTTLGVLTKTSLDSVASLEQNIGGIETLFGTRGAKTVEEYADLVGEKLEYVAAEFEMLEKAQTLALNNANDAYKTAGLSANEYMETVTSFAAALKQSAASELDAAEIANQTVIDMADNANKMGTNMELIQNAYQGFAKQNYTMLDNLKLGYGGTKKEMQRLLKDAQALTGVKYDIDNLADVYEAIHVIQTELGITGTTAKEAATTIEGSMNSAKAAWDNFLNGTADADQLASAFETVGTVISENLEEIIPRLVETIPAAAKAMVPAIATVGSSLASMGMEILNDFVSGMQEATPLIPAKAGELVSLLITGIQENAPGMFTTATELLAKFVEGIGAQLPSLVPQALEMVVTIADGIISNIPTIVNAGISLLGGLVQGIINSLPTLIAEGPRIINDFANAIYSGLGTLITTGLDMIVSLVQGLWDNKDLLLENAGEIFMAFLNIFSLSNMVSLGKNLLSSLQKGIKSFLPNIKSVGKEVLTNLVNGIKALANDPVSVMLNISRSIRSAITSFSWSSIGSNIISGIASGLKRGVGTIISAAKSAAASALTAAKKALGIKSPSRRFRDEVGKMMAVGMGEGFEKNVPVDEMQDTIDTSVKKIQKASYSVTSKTPATTGSVVAREVFASAKNPTTDEETTREIVIHTHVELDGEKVGDGITRYVDRNMADNEELKERGC